MDDDDELITYESGVTGLHLGTIRTVDPCFHFLQAGTHFPIIDFCVDRKILFNMVQTKTLIVYYILAGGAIASISALPVPPLAGTSGG
jgi:hypothetical protein